METAKLIVTRINIKKDFISYLDDIVNNNVEFLHYKGLGRMIREHKIIAIQELKILEEHLADIEMRFESIEDDTLKKILKLRFMECKKVEAIAREMYMSQQWVFVLIKRGLEQYNKTNGGAD